MVRSSTKVEPLSTPDWDTTERTLEFWPWHATLRRTRLLPEQQFSVEVKHYERPWEFKAVVGSSFAGERLVEAWIKLFEEGPDGSA